ncbi:MAG TPA: hypothetical protein VM327_10580, partial [Candidatus Thermoplasmatota archaeon]|nr:hypothetical protein [Candidatus Thermoplasmatota archaeon]
RDMSGNGPVAVRPPRTGDGLGANHHLPGKYTGVKVGPMTCAWCQASHDLPSVGQDWVRRTMEDVHAGVLHILCPLCKETTEYTFQAGRLETDGKPDTH